MTAPFDGHSSHVSSATVLLSDHYLTAGETMTVTFVFNEKPWWNTGWGSPSFTLTTTTGSRTVPPDSPLGALSNLTQDSNNLRVFTAKFTPTAGIMGKAVGRITLDLSALGYSFFSRLSGVFQSAEYTVDATPPDAVSNPRLNHVTISLSHEVLTYWETMTVTFEFNEVPWSPIVLPSDVPPPSHNRSHSFTTHDVEVSHGTLSNLVQNRDNLKIFTATFTPNDHINRAVGRITLNLANLRDSTEIGNDGTG
ncbi:hypothetical protein D8B24_12600, partial [Verminephrobacter aporrectodeae subsp. tuberculatae]|uniref:Ig-like domain-containing protein n=1 Tax=Verminephrobacter aporrectodeae TaxID=1110389 RepID=UPI002244B29E